MPIDNTPGQCSEQEDLEFSNIGRRRNIVGLLAIITLSLTVGAVLVCAGLGVFDL